MPDDRYLRFAKELARQLVTSADDFQEDSQHHHLIRTADEAGRALHFDLRPFVAKPVGVSGMTFFANVRSVSGLLAAYQSARQSLPFEMDSEAGREHVAEYANDFVAALLARGNAALVDEQARLIGDWVKNLDVYCAVKAIESFIHGGAELKLLEIASRFGWDLVLDHLAIRAGSSEHRDAERVAELLKVHHGYVSPQVKEQAFYQSEEGWSALPVYKILANGQVLRVFVDQSDEEHPQQIIQHWNHVYGYTPHHIALRATVMLDGVRRAVPVSELMGALREEGVEFSRPIGEQTRGLLVQVITEPRPIGAIPPELKEEVACHGEQLARAVESAKLLELVSRREMPPALAERYFALYGLSYDAGNPLHSAPVYQYFLPAQAAHVIRSSQEVA